jgi:parallel beta-helix repeat protein
MKKKFSIWNFVLVALVFFSISLQAATYTVDDNGPADFTTIQAAINFAGPNDVVYVLPGTYREAVTMKERVNLFGAGPHVTTIDGQGIRNYVVTYDASTGAIISGFRVTGSRKTGTLSWTYSGIYCKKGPLIVRNNIIENNHAGIAVEAAAKPTIINNTILGNNNGVIFAGRGDAWPLVDVGFIYYRDIKGAESYAELLKEGRLSVGLIPLGEVPGVDLEKYRVLIVGPDTGSMGNWGTPEAVAAIVKSGRPVIGLGEGGYAFFGKVIPEIGYPHGAHDEHDTSIFVMNRNHIIFNKPYRITVPFTGIISLYEEPVPSVSIYLEPVPRGVVVLGRHTASEDHYTLVEGGKKAAFFWGFNGTPAVMSKTGKPLFLNVVQYMRPTIQPPAKTHTIMNNIVVNNKGMGGIVYYVFGNDGEILYNDVWNNSKNYFDNHTGSSFSPDPGTGEISADPRFADAVYRLAEGSPCIDTGHPGPQYNDPDGTRNDMGAYGGPEASGLSGFGGSGFIITEIGNIPAVEINQDKDHLCHGLADVNATEASLLGIPQYKDCPFGGDLWIHGLFGTVDPITHYQILVGKWEDSEEPNLAECTPLSDSLTKVKYYIDDANGMVTYKYLSLGPKSIGDVDNLYELTSGEMQPEWVGGKLYWTCWTEADLRMRWYTPPWENGKYIIRYRAYNYHPWFGLTELSLNSTTLDHLTLIVDNNPVDANIHSVKYDSGEVIPVCGIIRLADANENLIFTITASHPTGYLRDYWLSALYGKNNSLGYVVQDHYTGLNEGGPPMWYGVTETPFNSADAPPGQLLPWETCAYQFHLVVWARTTDGRNQVIYWKEFNDHYYLDVGGCAWCGGADINHSGKVDWFDFAIFASHWLDSCGPTCE